MSMIKNHEVTLVPDRGALRTIITTFTVDSKELSKKKVDLEDIVQEFYGVVLEEIKNKLTQTVVDEQDALNKTRL